MFGFKKKKLPSRWIRLGIPAALAIAWLAFAGVGGPYFGKISEVSSTDLATFLPKSAEATKVNDRLAGFREDGTVPAIIVFEKKSGDLVTQDTTQIKDATASLKAIHGVKSGVSPPIESEDKKAAYVVVPLDSEGELDEVFASIQKTLDSKQLSTEYKMTGPASFSKDLTKAFAGIDGLLLLVALVVVFVILLLVYRSPILPIAVLSVALCALAVSIFVVWHLAKADVVQLNGQVQGILFILVIGATTDYSLLYIARYREELRKQKHVWDATVASLKASIEPITASGGTVMVGLFCLLLSDLNSNKALGPVGAIGIAFAITSALTFLPAILAILGRGAFWPSRPMYGGSSHRAEKQHPVWANVAAFVQKRPRALWVGTALALLVAAVGATTIKADGVAQSELILGASEARDGQKLLDKHFPAGSGSPVSIVVPTDKIDQMVEVIDKRARVDGVSAMAENSVSGMVPLGKSANKIKSQIEEQVANQVDSQRAELKSSLEMQMVGAPSEQIEAAYQSAIAATPPIEAIVSQAYPFKNATAKSVDGDSLLQVTLDTTPDSQAAKDMIPVLRKTVRQVDQRALVGGITAIQYDTNNASIHDRKVIIPIILLAITIILMLLLRSILAPLLLLGTTLLSFFATLGVGAFLFNHVWDFPGADPSVVLYSFVFLVALGIDYNIFLMTRVREESLRFGTKKGVVKGLIVTGGVITSAGVVLAATFAALAVIPILFLAQLAFLVAFGVLLDTLLVRSIIVPALILDIGSKVWWPSKLMRKK